MDPHHSKPPARASVPVAFSRALRALVRRLAPLVPGRARLLAVLSAASARYRGGHRTTLGKQCRQHEDCRRGVCGAAGVCLSCAGVAAWTDAGLARLDEFDRLATAAVDAIAGMADRGFDVELVGHIRATAGAIGQIDEGLQAEVAPAAAANPLRDMLKALAAVADALAAYLDQIYEENFLENGERAINAILAILADVPSLRVEIAALREACRDP